MTSVATRPNPFPGLRPFEANEDHLFFGRDGQSDEILGRLRRNRFLAVVGSSGSGKSSLIRAGLLPSLYGGLMTKAGSNWRIAVFRPGNDTIGSLTSALSAPGVLRTDGADALHTIFTETTLRRSAFGLIDAVRHARMPAEDNLLIVVDQFEELFRFRRTASRPDDEAAAFVKLLLEATQQTEAPIYVVITMRSDFIGDCARFRDLPETVNQGLYLIPRMTRDQRREAITGPIAVGGAQITPRLVNRLLNDVGDSPDQLPILQHALMRTWSNWSHESEPSEPIDLRHYEAIGGMAEALSRHADRAYNELPDDRSRQIAEKLFKCLTEKGLDNREVRRPSSVSEICAVAGASETEVISVIEPFRRPGRSFLMPPSTVQLNADSLIDISHESLIRNWDRLRSWVEAEALSATIYRRVADTAVLYSEGHAALWRDPDLQVALGWRENAKPNRAWAQRYHPAFDLAMKFLDESRAARDAHGIERETRRRKELRRTRVFAAVLAVAFLIASAFGVWAVDRTREARKQGNYANQKAIEAEQQRVEADEQRRKAQDQEAVALSEAKKAYAAKTEADRLLTRALSAEQEATDNARRAEAALEDAQTQKLLAERKQREAEGLAEDLRIEAMRAREENLDNNQTIASLSKELIQTSSPQRAVYWHRQRQLALSKMGRHRDAIKELLRALEIDPENRPAQSSLASESILVGKAEETVKTLERLGEGTRTYVDHLNLGIAYGILGRYQDAMASIDRAISVAAPYNSGVDTEVSPDIKRATGHTVIYVEGDAFKTALQYQRASIKAFAGANDFVNELEKANNLAEGIDDHQKLDAYLQAMNWIWLQLRNRTDDYGGLVSQGVIWERAARIKPDFIDPRFDYLSWRSYADFRETHEKYKTQNPVDHRYDDLAKWVAQHLKKTYPDGPPAALQDEKKDARTLALEAREFKERGQLSLADKRLSEALKLLEDEQEKGRREWLANRRSKKPPDLKGLKVNLLIERALVREGAKDYAGVKEDCELILKLAPETTFAYQLLAYAYDSEQANDKKKAEYYYRETVKRDPDNRFANQYLSQIVAETDGEEALSLLEQSIKSRSDDPALFYRKAELQSKNAGVNKQVYAQALRSINTAIAMKSDDIASYDLRAEIESALGKSRIEVVRNQGAGYREAGDTLARLGKSGPALDTYIKSLKALEREKGNPAIECEVSVTVHTISSFIENRWSKEKAVEFWETMLSSGLEGAERIAKDELSRLSGRP